MRDYRLGMIKTIAEIRSLQEKAAELDAASAADAVEKMTVRQGQALDQRASEDSAWAQALSGPSFDLQIARSWSSVLVDRVGNLRQIAEDLRGAEALRSRKNADWNEACARAQGAGETRTMASRRVRRLREERELADLTDRLASRRHHES